MDVLDPSPSTEETELETLALIAELSSPWLPLDFQLAASSQPTAEFGLTTQSMTTMMTTTTTSTTTTKFQWKSTCHAIKYDFCLAKSPWHPAK